MEYEYSDLSWKYFTCVFQDEPEQREKVWIEENEEEESTIQYLWIPIYILDRGIPNDHVTDVGFRWWSRNNQCLSWYQQNGVDTLELDFQNPRGLDFISQLEEKICKHMYEKSMDWFRKKLTIQQLEQLMKTCIRWNGKKNGLSIRASYYEGLFPESIRRIINPTDVFDIQFQISGFEIYQQYWNVRVEIVQVLPIMNQQERWASMFHIPYLDEYEKRRQIEMSRELPMIESYLTDNEPNKKEIPVEDKKEEIILESVEPESAVESKEDEEEDDELVDELRKTMERVGQWIRTKSDETKSERRTEEFKKKKKKLLKIPKI
jgi:hypothetical protein